MNDQAISKDSLNELPRSVQHRIDKTSNLRSSFEALCDCLNEEHIPIEEHRDSVAALLRWVLTVLSEASEPLLDTTFAKLGSDLTDALSFVQQQQWPSYDATVERVLTDLSLLPRVHSGQSIHEAQSLTETIKESRRELRGAGTRLKTLYADTERSLQREFETARQGLVDDLETSQKDASAAAQTAVRHQDTADSIVNEMKTLLGVSTDVAWGGTYDVSSEHDQKAANRLRWVAFGLYTSAATVAFVGLLVISSPATGWDWLSRLSFGGPVAIFLWAAAYASRESSEHRNSSRLFKHQSLAFISMGNYAERIAQMAASDDDSEVTQSPSAAAFLSKISESLFTKQIDAHTEQIKAQGRGSRAARKLERVSSAD